MKIQSIGGTLLGTNNYIVGNDKEVILIETSASYLDVKAVLGKRKVKAIFLTHGHWDHAQHVDEFVEKFKAKVYAHEKAFEKLAETEKKFQFDRPIASKLKKDSQVVLQDEEIIDFGFLKVKVLFTPGHTNCSISLLVSDEEGQVLFTGDTLFLECCGRYDLPTSSISDMKKSLQKLLNLDGSLNVYPGHGFKTTISHEVQTFQSIL